MGQQKRMRGIEKSPCDEDPMMRLFSCVYVTDDTYYAKETVE